MGTGHPECPERLDAIEDRLLVTGVGDALERYEAPEASLADIELAHGRMHIAALRGLSDRLNEELMAGGPSYAQIDTDTSINAHTWNASLRAAGAALAATDAVMSGEVENAFSTSPAITASVAASAAPAARRDAFQVWALMEVSVSICA